MSNQKKSGDNKLMIRILCIVLAALVAVPTIVAIVQVLTA